MKKIFYFGLIGLSVFEILNVYFIMPMPGSQQMDSIALAYFLYSWRWAFRIIFFLMLCIGASAAFTVKNKWIPVLLLASTLAIVYLFNFYMTADKMFLQPRETVFKQNSDNKVPANRVVLVVHNKGESKAYPISFIAYHHQVVDTIGGKQIMVTYCSVCRTGRVFEPVVNGKQETFRLVGMDHFNAMFEDASTGSWWRQATGEAVVGELKGSKLPELYSEQLTVGKFFQLYPNGKVMQEDEFSLSKYDSLARFEQGKSKSNLTRTDLISWTNKAWIVGIVSGNHSRAYDWNELKKRKIIQDTLNNMNIVLTLSDDQNSFIAFENTAKEPCSISNDTIYCDSLGYDMSGRGITTAVSLKKIEAYQEYWHSWLTFHPHTTRYPGGK